MVQKAPITSPVPAIALTFDATGVTAYFATPKKVTTWKQNKLFE